MSHKVGLRKISRNEPVDALRAEIEKEDAEIEALRAKAEERRKRQEEDARRQEEEKARLDAEKRAREEEEKRRKEEHAQRKRQLELEKLEAEKTKKQVEEMVSLGEAGGSKLSNVLKAKEDMNKSPEQLEQEKREILASRLVNLKLDGLRKDDLIKQAEEFYQTLFNIHSQIYDLTEKYERQRYDMMELAERARQIEKGKAKTRKSNIVHTGLGGSVFPWITEVCAQAPQKISLFSRYERVTDRRTFKDRRDLWSERKEKAEFIPIKPLAKIKHVDEPKQESFPRKKRQPAADQAPADEHHEEEHHEEEHHEEEHHEEQPAEEQPAEEQPAE